MLARTDVVPTSIASTLTLPTSSSAAPLEPAIGTVAGRGLGAQQVPASAVAASLALFRINLRLD